MFYAHSGGEDRSAWQPLAVHSLAVADLAERFGSRIGLGEAARLAGLLHDLGKYTAIFQRRLTGANERVDHSTAGARMVLDLVRGRDRTIAELIAYAIAGHHAGLPDRISVSGSLEQRLEHFDVNVLDPVWRSEIAPALGEMVPNFKFDADKEVFAFQLGLLGRMLFSCLVDAGAWIETWRARGDGQPVARRSPCGSVDRNSKAKGGKPLDRNVAPHAGAWIETRLRGNT